MKLTKKPHGLMEEYFCDLTRDLDTLAGIKPESHIKHYILADDYAIKEKILAIRIPGGTVGALYFDDNNTITNIIIDTKYVVRTYADNVNEYITNKYIGKTFTIEKEEPDGMKVTYKAEKVKPIKVNSEKYGKEW